MEIENCFDQYLDVLTGGSKSVRFFLPLCGKAGDLLYLYNEGHTVTGVEGVPYVVEQFFRENKLEYEKVENILLRISFNIVSPHRSVYQRFVDGSTGRKTTGCASMLVISSPSHPR